MHLRSSGETFLHIRPPADGDNVKDPALWWTFTFASDAPGPRWSV